MLSQTRKFILALILSFLTFTSANAQDRTPDLGTTVPDQWVTDRYDPAGFNLVDTFMGRDNVLQIDISGDARPAPYNSSFYNTQGRSIAIDPVGTTSASSNFLFDLFIPNEWESSSNGLRRTDMWARMNEVNSSNESSANYPILGFTNQGGIGLFRFWSDAGWNNLTDPVKYGEWNTLSLNIGTEFWSAFINGNNAYSEVANPNAPRVDKLMLQAYQFDDSFDGSEVNPAYSANWSNVAGMPTSSTPEPATMVLLGTGLIAMIGLSRRKKKIAQPL